MHSTRGYIAALFGGVLLLGAQLVHGQAYPNKPIRIITTEAGGGGDFTGRLIAPALSSRMGQPVVIDNRVALIGTEAAAKAPADGYTLLLNGLIVWVQPLLRSAPWDPINDFSTITLVTSSPLVLVVHPSLPVKTVKELIALAKAKPGQLDYGAQGIGAPPHLAAELFKSMAGVDIVRINYKGGAQSLTALSSGEIQVLFGNAVPVATQIKAGKFRPLAVTSAEPSKLFPSLPTMAQAGLPGFEMGQPIGMFAPAKTPVAIINRLNQEIVRAINEPDIKEKFFNTGSEIVGSSPEQFMAAIKSDIVRIGKVIKDQNIHAD